nr:hypothetical protein [Tanacetum cinerariifolium]
EALELGKSISSTEAKEKEVARQVHATHARTVTESKPKPAKKKIGNRSTRSVVIHDTLSDPKSKPAASKPKLKGSSEGTGRQLGVPGESTVISASSTEGTSTEPGVLDKEKVTSGEKGDDEKKDDTDDDKSIDLEITDDEETDDKVLQEISDVAKANAEKTEEVKEETKKAKLPLTSSSLYVSSGFSDQFLKISSDSSLIGTVKDTIDAKINSLLDIKIQSEVPHIQSLFMLKVHMFVIFEPFVLLPIKETPSATHVTTLAPISVSTISHVPLQ